MRRKKNKMLVDKRQSRRRRSTSPQIRSAPWPVFPTRRRSTPELRKRRGGNSRGPLAVRQRTRRGLENEQLEKKDHWRTSRLQAHTLSSVVMAAHGVAVEMVTDGQGRVLVTVTPPADGPPARKCISAVVDTSYSMHSAANEKGDELVRWFSKLDIVKHGALETPP